MVVEPSRSVYEVAPLTEFQETLIEPVPQEPAVAERAVGAPRTVTQALATLALREPVVPEFPPVLYARRRYE